LVLLWLMLLWWAGGPSTHTVVGVWEYGAQEAT
jgi:hypothetical protein